MTPIAAAGVAAATKTARSGGNRPGQVLSPNKTEYMQYETKLAALEQACDAEDGIALERALAALIPGAPHYRGKLAARIVAALAEAERQPPTHAEEALFGDLGIAVCRTCGRTIPAQQTTCYTCRHL